MQTAIKRGSKAFTPEERRAWSITKEQIGNQLRNHYQSYANEELPPRLLALVKRLESKPEFSAEEMELIRKAENEIELS